MATVRGDHFRWVKGQDALTGHRSASIPNGTSAQPNDMHCHQLAFSHDRRANAMAAIVFDLDDTLCNWTEAQALAQKAATVTLVNHGLPTNLFWAAFEKTHSSLYQEFVDGTLTTEEFRIRRFSLPLNELGCHDRRIAESLNDVFVTIANTSVTLNAAAERILSKAKALGFRLGLLTNGPSDGQRTKLGVLGITSVFDSIAISEEVGFGKPTAKAFESICTELGCDTRDSLMIGDSKTADALPALTLGMAAYLVTAEGAPEDIDVARWKRGRSGSLCALEDLLAGWQDW